MDKLVQLFLEAARNGNFLKDGWPEFKNVDVLSYPVSKTAISALSRIQQREFDTDLRDDIVVNHVHPGCVETDMTKWMKNKNRAPATEGAKAPIFATTLPPGTKIKCQFIWDDCQIVDWENGSLPEGYVTNRT